MLGCRHVAREMLHDCAEALRLVKDVCVMTRDQRLVIFAKPRLGRQDQNRNCGIAWVLPQPRQQINAGLFTEVEVQNDRADMVLFGGGHRFGDRGRVQGCESMEMKQAAQNASDSSVVVYDQYVAFASFGAVRSREGEGGFFRIAAHWRTRRWCARVPDWCEGLPVVQYLHANRCAMTGPLTVALVCQVVAVAVWPCASTC